MIIIGFVFLAIIIPFSVIYRQADIFLTTESRGFSSKINAMMTAVQKVDISTDQIYFIFAYIFGRFSRLEQSLRIIDWTPRYRDYKYGTTIFPLIFTSLIPTAIYPNRPLTNIGKWFGIAYGFTDAKEPVFITAGVFNELYLNFSIYGFLFCILIGFFIKKCYIFWCIHKDSLFINLLYFNIWNSLCFWLNETYIVSGIMDVFKSTIFLIFIFVFIYFLDKNKRRLTWT